MLGNHNGNEVRGVGGGIITIMTDTNFSYKVAVNYHDMQLINTKNYDRKYVLGKKILKISILYKYCKGLLCETDF